MSQFLDIEIGDRKLPPMVAYWQHSVVPLDEALQPVKFHFDPLTKQKNIAVIHQNIS
jgi:hypothetical protein